MEKKISLSQIGLYNPRRQSTELSEKLFVIRQKQFEMLMEELNAEEENSIPQHHIVIAQRGMGKTTLLNRMAIELQKPEYNSRFIPLAFPEEQYNITNLGDFWLNCLDALADSLEMEHYDATKIELVDNQVKELSLHKNSETTASQAYRFLMDFCKKINRRPVLLIDNIGILFNKLGKNEQHKLRALLSENGAPIIMGAGVNVVPSQSNSKADVLKPITNYDMPFYDYFQIRYLKKLTFEEFLELIKKLSDITQVNTSVINGEMQRLQSLHYLTGGNPRTAVMLFKLVAKGFAAEINDDLEALLDEITPLYKARYEELSEQSQKILVEVALNDKMDAISLKKLSQKTGYANNQLSPQLKRLIEDGWLETTPAEKNKGNAYRMCERFFNLWLLMRQSTRRRKQEITLLAKFLESFYGEDKLQQLTENHACREFESLKDGYLAKELVMTKLIDKKTKIKLEQAIEILGNEVDLSNDDLKYEIEEIKDKKIERAIKQEKFEEAIQLLTEKISRNPNDAYAYYNRGYAKGELSDYQGAIADYTKGIEINPNDAEVYYNRGNAKINLSDYQGAIADYTKAIEINPNYAKAYNNRGKAKFALSDYQGAIADFTKAIECDNNYMTPKLNLLELCRDKLGKMAEAKELFEEIKERLEIDNRFLQETLFELHNRNEGLAKEYLLQALQSIEKELPISTINIWYDFAAICLDLKYGEWLLAILEETRFDKNLAPYFVAIRAILIEKQECKNDKEKAENKEKAEIYLKNRAIEIAEPARIIIKRISINRLN
jgi:tetratricopeptide (TPR) repeat protein